MAFHDETSDPGIERCRQTHKELLLSLSTVCLLVTTSVHSCCGSGLPKPRVLFCVDSTLMDQHSCSLLLWTVALPEDGPCPQIVHHLERTWDA